MSIYVFRIHDYPEPCMATLHADCWEEAEDMLRAQGVCDHERHYSNEMED